MPVFQLTHPCWFSGLSCGTGRPVIYLYYIYTDSLFFLRKNLFKGRVDIGGNRKGTNKAAAQGFHHVSVYTLQGQPLLDSSLIMDEKFTLDKEKNPAFEFSEAEYWLAYKDGRLAGRIAGIISHSYIEKWGQPYARFGWVDFIDDPEVSKALFDTVENWAKDKGLKAVHGPLGFCDLDKQGMLIEGFDEDGTFITIYNYPYYPEHMEALGYVKDAEWIEIELKMPGMDLINKMEELAEKAKKKYNLKVAELKSLRMPFLMPRRYSILSMWAMSISTVPFPLPTGRWIAISSSISRS